MRSTKTSKNNLETNENGHPMTQNLWESSSKMEIYSNIGLHRKTRKIINKQSKLTPKGTRKKTTTKA